MRLSSEIIKALTSLKQGTSPGKVKAPHKPMLLLAVIQSIGNGDITENKIFITAELVGLFRGYWNKLVTSGHTPNFALPFYHLNNERSSIWKLNVKHGFERALTSSKSIKSLSMLEEFCNWAELRADVFIAASDPILRMEMQGIVLEKYFHQNIEVLNSTSNYTQAIEDLVLQDSAENYKKKFEEAILKVTKEEAEEEQFIRGSTFKKLVPRLYDNTCAITGMHIVAKSNISMVDACHIVPFSETHDDHITNGIALSPTMHRAFDRGLIAIDDYYRVLVADNFVENYSSNAIHQFEGKEIKLPENEKYYPKLENFKEHRLRFNFH